jgi:hypothetical protein
VDVDRSAVYAAELRAFEGTDLEDVAEFGGIAARMDLVVNGEWWAGPAVDVLSSRADAASSSTRCVVTAHGGRATIRLARAQTTIATAAHELGHALAGVGEGHGPVFRAAYLDVVAVITNADSTDRRHELHVHQLATAFAEDGLSVGERRWPQPPASTTTAIAL